MLLCRGLLTALLVPLALSESLVKQAEDLANKSPLQGCAKLCSVLEQLIPKKTDQPGSALYSSALLGYWSQQQQQQKPACRLSPTQPIEVAAAVVLSRLAQCPFAVKSGGHASFANASNTNVGLAIDLQNLNSIVVSKDRKTVSTGAGARWEQVYSKLDAINLAVIGGRNGDIGVSGLTLGGGISFFSGLHGWACDNVKNFQVVLANGQIVNVNATSRPDLYYALRGGGNNFGVVTRLDLGSFEHGDMWGGMTYYDVSKNRSAYDAFYWFNANSDSDPKGALIVAISYIQGQFVMSNSYEYIDPVANPPVFRNFTAIPSLGGTMRITQLSNLTKELKDTQPRGLRQIFETFSFRNNAELHSEILNIFTKELQPILGIKSLLPSLVFQPLQNAVIARFGQNGGNALGIKTSDGPLTIMNINLSWAEESEDAHVIGIAQTIMAKAIALAKKRGLFHPYIYQNYAYITQDVIGGYGAESNARLRAVQKKYDPLRVFQRLQPGYFKLPTA